MNELREKLAELAHEQWSGWMRYLFDNGVFNSDGTWTMPAQAVERWGRQMRTPYSELSEDERNSDRNEADKMLAVIETAPPHKFLDAADLEHWANLYCFEILDEWECLGDLVVERVGFWDWLSNEYPDELNEFEYWFKHEKDSEKLLFESST